MSVLLPSSPSDAAPSENRSLRITPKDFQDRLSSCNLALMCSILVAISLTQKKELGIVKDGLQNDKLKNYMREERFRMQEVRCPRDRVISPIVSHHRLGRSLGPASLTAFTRPSPLVKFFLLFFHLDSSFNHFLPRKIAYNEAGSLWACAKPVPTTLTYSDSVAVPEIEP